MVPVDFAFSSLSSQGWRDRWSYSRRLGTLAARRIAACPVRLLLWRGQAEQRPVGCRTCVLFERPHHHFEELAVGFVLHLLDRDLSSQMPAPIVFGGFFRFLASRDFLDFAVERLALRFKGFTTPSRNGVWAWFPPLIAERFVALRPLIEAGVLSALSAVRRPSAPAHWKIRKLGILSPEDSLGAARPDFLAERSPSHHKVGGRVAVLGADTEMAA